MTFKAMGSLFFAGVLTACSEKRVDYSCEGQEQPGVRAWGGNDLDVLMPDGARSIRAVVQSDVGVQTLELELIVDGAPWGMNYENCPWAPDAEGRTLQVPVRWSLSSSDGYLDGATGDPMIAEYRDELMHFGGTQRARRLEWPFSRSDARPQSASLAFSEALGVDDWSVFISESYKGREPFGFAVYWSP